MVLPIMHTSIQKLINFGRNSVAAAAQISNAFNQAQSALQLENILSQDRLSTIEGTTESLTTLRDLRELTNIHKEAYSKFILSTEKEIAKIMEEMPQDLSNEELVRHTESINWHLNFQQNFYQNRERWTDAAENICNLIMKCRENIEFTEDGIVFMDINDEDEFEKLLNIIEETHQIEVAAQQERLSRIMKSAAILGLTIKA